MSLPAPREPRRDGWQETIRDAISSNARTFRLCLILLVAAVPSFLAFLELVRHIH